MRLAEWRYFGPGTYIVAFVPTAPIERPGTIIPNSDFDKALLVSTPHRASTGTVVAMAKACTGRTDDESECACAEPVRYDEATEMWRWM